MQVSTRIPEVMLCTVSECSYNADNGCHAKAITVGDGATPACDTMLCGSQHVQAHDIHGGVGACKVSGCTHNRDLECTAESISVGLVTDSVNCLTYNAP